MTWQETAFSFSAEPYDIVAPPPGVAVVGDLQVVADTTDCEDIRHAWKIQAFGGGDEYTCTVQYFDETEQQWIEIATQLSPGGSGPINEWWWTNWFPLPSGAVGSAVTFRPIGVDGDSTTTASISDWEIRVRKQVAEPEQRANENSARA